MIDRIITNPTVEKKYFSVVACQFCLFVTMPLVKDQKVKPSPIKTVDTFKAIKIKSSDSPILSVLHFPNAKPKVGIMAERSGMGRNENRPGSEAETGAEIEKE